jgi:hypothetical protein
MFELPETTVVNRVIPKNSFEKYATASQRKQFTECVQKIIWLHKLSEETTNLQGNEIKEIQVFLIELKQKQKIDGILSVIDKAIPYPIIFSIRYDSIYYYSASQKHVHPLNEDNAIIDWTFKTDWLDNSNNQLSIVLKKNLESVFENFCFQISNPKQVIAGLNQLADYDKKFKSLQKEKERLTNAINTSKQFNKKVELNLELKAIEKLINGLK